MSNPQPDTGPDKAFADGCAWVDGSFVPIGEAQVPMLDTGFTRSDCTYDVVSVWNNRFFRLDEHLDRFAQSLQIGRFKAPVDRAGMRGILFECVRRAGLEDAYVEMIVSRGVPPPGERDPRRFQNRFYAFAIPYVWIMRPELWDSGLSIVIARDTTRIDPRAVDPRMKNFHWGDLTAGLYEAFDRDAGNVILLNGAGEVTEGPGFNIFAVCGNALWTPASGVLEGITRRTIIELAERRGIASHVTMFGPQRLHGADEIFITSTAGGVMPVTALDGAPVSGGKPGPLTQQLHDDYWAAHGEPAWSCPVT